MIEERVSFYSERELVSGILRLPDDVHQRPVPAVVQGPGWLQVKEAKRNTPYHEAWAEAGIATLIIDFRGFGESEGDRSDLLPDRWITDLQNAVSYLCTREDIDPRRIGTFGSGNIRAWTVASETGYRSPALPLKPRFSAKADISSGDNPSSKTLGTFNPLFPKGNYFGVLATTGPGPINFIDFHPHIETTFPHNVTASVDWIFQWRENVLDGVYSVPGFLIRPAGDSKARFVGNRPGMELRWQVDRHIWCQADYGIFYAGRFLKETQPGRNLNYWALWAGYKF